MESRQFETHDQFEAWWDQLGDELRGEEVYELLGDAALPFDEIVKFATSKGWDLAMGEALANPKTGAGDRSWAMVTYGTRGDGCRCKVTSATIQGFGGMRSACWQALVEAQLIVSGVCGYGR